MTLTNWNQNDAWTNHKHIFHKNREISILTNKSQATQLPIHITIPTCKELVTLLPIYYINSGCLCVRLSDTTILHFNSPAEPASAFSMAEPACGSWWRPSVTELGSVTEGRLGPVRHSRIFTDRARRGGCRAGSVTEGRPGLEWYLFTSTIRIHPNFNLTVKFVFLPTPHCFSLEARFPNER
jgi:hypothetical protein